MNWKRKVSTHSRLKAAGPAFATARNRESSFNTQPPEGGWGCTKRLVTASARFNTQPPEGGWLLEKYADTEPSGFNTQPPEGGWARAKERLR